MSETPESPRREQPPPEPPPASGPRVVVDEDWKERVRKEREAASAARRSQRPEGQPPSDEEAAAVPPASLEALVTMFAAQAMAAMGLMPDPQEGKPVVRLEIARHCIDILGMLEEKTQGNRTEAETQLLTRMLHELRMLYISSGAPR